MNIIITGGSRGIGRELAKKFSTTKETQILVISRDETALRILSESCDNKNIVYLADDLNDLVKSPEKLLKMVSEYFSSVDILVNNAGFLIRSPFEDIKQADEEMMVSTNFLTPARLIRAIRPLFRMGSHIVNIGSMAGFQGSSKFPGLSIYGAAKAGLASLTESLAVEYADRGISFNCLSIGAVQTDMLNVAFPGFKAPLEPDQMAEFIQWFTLHGNKYFNGKILPVALSNPAR